MCIRYNLILISGQESSTVNKVCTAFCRGASLEFLENAIRSERAGQGEPRLSLSGALQTESQQRSLTPVVSPWSGPQQQSSLWSSCCCLVGRCPSSFSQCCVTAQLLPCLLSAQVQLPSASSPFPAPGVTSALSQLSQGCSCSSSPAWGAAGSPAALAAAAHTQKLVFGQQLSWALFPALWARG